MPDRIVYYMLPQCGHWSVERRAGERTACRRDPKDAAQETAQPRRTYNHPGPVAAHRRDRRLPLQLAERDRPAPPSD
jgi:hypothetical protein